MHRTQLRDVAGGAGERDDPVRLAQQRRHGGGVELDRKQHGSMSECEVVGRGDCAGEGELPVQGGDRARAGALYCLDQRSQPAPKRRADRQRHRLAERALDRPCPDPREASVEGPQDVDDDLREPLHQLRQLLGAQLERGRGDARNDRLAVRLFDDHADLADRGSLSVTSEHLAR